ncbi:hypothetical protein [Williamsia sterculiae]|uniref:Alpha/beta hydrolase family protein n=1 Tax=Williamsia sterculiae TaxID=1344003 RepID=A0A1N7HAT6_9NOCA|nr:hypothetical protein [Williamsia sterculiae]SIS21999.1 hypothetical protein SAMN05445060_3862 [Williamsia sterculiae]
MQLMFLHGLGEGGIDDKWFAALNEQFAKHGWEQLERRAVVSPRYAGALATSQDADLPKPKRKTAHDVAATAEYQCRQIDAARSVISEPDTWVPGISLLDVGIGHQLVNFAARNGPTAGARRLVGQLNRYCTQQGVKAAVLNTIIDQVPNSGEVVLVGHSLGSVILMDLIPLLPPELKIRRVVTIGSPADKTLFAKSRETLAAHFPYPRIGSWLNFYSLGDPVTSNRGLATELSQVQDVRIRFPSDDEASSGGLGHDAARYFQHPAVAQAIAASLFATNDPPRKTSRVRSAMTEDVARMLLALHYRYAVADLLDGNKKVRFEQVIESLRNDFVDSIFAEDKAGNPLPRELHQLAEGNLTPMPKLWDRRAATAELTIIALSNLIAPFEIDTLDEQLQALPKIASALNLSPDDGATIANAIASFKEAVRTETNHKWGKYALGAAGIALIAAGPVGLAAAAPMGLGGAAAMTGGLAAFGPGGMVGGLAAFGGLAGSGAAITASAAGMSSPNQKMQTTELYLRSAVAHAQNALGEEHDEQLPEVLAAFVNDLASQLSKTEALSDKKSASISSLRDDLALAERLQAHVEQISEQDKRTNS